MTQRIATKNNMGWAISPDDEYVNSFINYSAEISPISSMEIGAAYGFVSVKALEKGAHLIVNDLCEEHLIDMQKNLSIDFKNFVQFMPGNFLSLELEPESVGAILIARVLHMLDEKDLEKAVQLVSEWLKPGGKVFITTATPYSNDLIKFLPVYENRKKTGVKNPGMITDLRQWLDIDNNNLPQSMQVFDLDILIDILNEKGFSILQASYIDRPHHKNIINNLYKDSCGIIAIKN